MEEIATPWIQELVASLSGRGAPAATRHSHRVLRLFLVQAVPERRLAVNTATASAYRALPAKLRGHVLTLEQVEALAPACGSSQESQGGACRA